MAAVEKITIKNEQEAWTALQQALAGEISETAQISFEGWPVFRLTIKGEDFNGTVPTRVMPPILELQKEIYRIYCRAKYQTEDTRALKQDDRDQLELVVVIEKGSTEFITELGKVLNEIVKSSKMDGKQVLILLVSVGAMLTTSVGWKDWLQTKERLHGEETTVTLSQEETKRLEMVTKALTQQPELKKTHEALDDFKSDLSKRLKAEDNIKVADQPIITGARAAEIVPTPRVQAKEIRLDGEFEINEVKFPKVFGGTYRFAVTRIADGRQLMVDAAPGVLSDQQISILKDGAFGIKHVIMEINAREGRSGITGANLVSISWPKADSARND